MSRAARIVAVLGAASLIVLGIRILHTHLKSQEERAPGEEAAEGSGLTPENALRCYFPVPVGLNPAEELRPKPESGSPLDLARALMEELHRGPENPESLRLFPEGTNLRASFLAHDGTLYLDYPAAVFDSASGPREEFLFMRCIARALLRNCAEVKAFVLLVDGHARHRMFLHLPAHGRYVLPKQ